MLHLKKDKQKTHFKLMKEQARAAKSKSRGKKKIKNRKWPTVVSATKAGNAIQTADRNRAKLSAQHRNIHNQLSRLHQPSQAPTSFSIKASASMQCTLVTITQGAIGYDTSTAVLSAIHLNVQANDRVSINGKNGSGKTSLLKAILNDAAIIKTGEWLLPKPEDIGYLDQHYQTLANDKTVFDTIKAAAPSWPDAEIRRYLNQYLFRKNEVVHATTNRLSCGEKARLSLAHCALNQPKLLVLDEITNNVDLETRATIIDVLNQYDGAMIVVSHDDSFLENIGITKAYDL